jgi:hypothetical protein
MPNPITWIFLSITVILSGCATVPAQPPTPDKVDFTWVINGDPQTYAQLAEHLFNVRTGCMPNNLCVVIKGPPSEVAAAIAMISKLESPQIDDGPGQSVLFAKYLKNANAAQVAATLEAMQQKGFRFSESPPWGSPLSVVEYAPKNMVWIRVDQIFQDRIRNILDELDSPPAPTTEPHEIRIGKGALINQ